MPSNVTNITHAVTRLILSRGIKLMKFKQIMRSMRLHRSYYRVQSFTYIVTHTLHSRFNGFAMTKGKIL